MSPDLLPAIASFARVAHHGSFTRAAAELGVSPSALSQSMRTLEARLQVRLLERSTRHVRPTEAGQRFLDEATPGLASLAAAIGGLDESRQHPAGQLRLNVSHSAVMSVLQPHLAAFADACPDIVLELHCDNALLDLVASGFDAGIRLGEDLVDGMVAVPLGPRQRLATVAAPSYLARRQAPLTPDALRDHRCIQVRLQSGIYRWEYARDGHDFTIETRGPVVTNDGATMMAALRAGVGIACPMEAMVADEIADGRLVPLLEAWWPAFPGYYLYYPTRVHVPRKLRAFIDFLLLRCNR
ncbi:LysR family transcriptional regulator [Paracidovorax cattleyae]|uniref:DNA-binding transcriptional regulator, LysR family n=1 Tax=Paracidovorax cattleyae TaxID=80868 RepID=A0A1H0V2C4_9BURK|nr:LysR family transcriptional regulator [Paracidovorax cattleyae]SDP72692.1 DNA-binding transcriptional regulator, LysR family [Paracidovorax cattleyae]